MAIVDIKPTDEECVAVLQSIDNLLGLRHIWHMSRSMLSQDSGVHDSKLRIVLQYLIDERYIEQYAVTDNPRRQRYIFTITDAGKAFMAKHIPQQ